MPTIPHVARDDADPLDDHGGDRRPANRGRTATLQAHRAGLVQTLVLGWLAEPAATRQQLTPMAARVGSTITPQALQQRFTAATAAGLEQVLAVAVTQVIQAEPVAIPLLRHFAAVLVQDSTTSTWPRSPRASGPRAVRTLPAPAGLKLQVRWDLCTGRCRGRCPNQRAPMTGTHPPPGPGASGRFVAGRPGLLLSGDPAALDGTGQFLSSLVCRFAPPASWPRGCR